MFCGFLHNSSRHQFGAQGALRRANFSPTHVNTDYWGNQITAASYNHTNQIISLNRLLTVKEAAVSVQTSQTVTDAN